MPVSIEKSGDLVGCHHSGTTNKQGKIGLLSQWTIEGLDEQHSKVKRKILVGGQLLLFAALK